MSINDLDMTNWKELTDIWTDSLWVIKNRDNSGAHTAKYHGNFIPQIANQLLRRYTKEGDFVIDPFTGSGTTLIEAQRLGRNSIGIELNEEVARESAERVRTEQRDNTIADIYGGDSSEINLSRILERYGKQKAQFIIYHPPYWDILKFSENEKDLCNATSLEKFLDMMRKVLQNTLPSLEKGRYCAMVIGDKYTKGELIPLGFYCMQLFQQEGLKLKATIVKNFEETKGKANQQAIWRYRALAGNFYLFKHEYIFVFKK